MWSAESIVLAMHFACVCLAVGIPIFCLVDDASRIGANDANDLADRACGRLMMHGVVWLAATAATGLAAGWLAWETGLAAALRRVGSRVPFGVVEFCFSLALMWAGGWWMLRRGRVSRSARWLRVAVQFLAWTNLVYHFPSFFAIVGELQADSKRTEILTSAEYRRLTFQMRTVWIWTHLSAASVITSGLYLLSGSSVALAWWHPTRIRRVLGAATAFVWFSGVGLQFCQPHGDLLWLYDASRLPFTLSWMVCAIATTAALLGIIQGARSRAWYAATWILLALTFWGMSVLAKPIGTT